MLRQLPLVAAGTGFGLGILIADRVGFCVHFMTGRAIDGAPVMCASYEPYLLLSHAVIPVASQAGTQLLLPG